MTAEHDPPLSVVETLRLQQSATLHLIWAWRLQSGKNAIFPIAMVSGHMLLAALLRCRACTGNSFLRDFPRQLCAPMYAALNRWVPFALAASCAVLGQPMGDTVIYVSPRGNDAWSGKLPAPNPDKTDEPVASLAGAREAVRRLKAQVGTQMPVRVQFADGTYQLTGPVDFTPEDSGTASAPIVYEAVPGAKPLFTGGRVISGWWRGPDGVWMADVPEVKSGQCYFEQLWVNGRRTTRAVAEQVLPSYDLQSCARC